MFGWQQYLQDFPGKYISDLANQLVISGVAANRPGAYGWNKHLLYACTDSGALYVSTGSSWIELGGGTVSSVAMTVPTGLSITGSPITSTGTLALSWSNEDANYVFAGPTSGSATTPTFRALTNADMPFLPGSITTNVLTKWNGTTGNLENSAVTDNGSSLSLSGAYTITTATGNLLVDSDAVLNLGTSSATEVEIGSSTIETLIAGNLSIKMLSTNVVAQAIGSNNLTLDTASNTASVGLGTGNAGLVTIGNTGGLVGIDGTLTLQNELTVANGGTGATTLTSHELLLGNGTSAISSLSNGTSGYVLTSNGSSAPSFQASATSIYPVTWAADAFQFVIGSGTWVLQTTTSQTYNYYYENTSANSGDYVTEGFFLASGTYTLYVLGVETTVNGKIQVLIDGSAQTGLIDFYNSGTIYNSIKTLSITVATSGTHTLKLQFDGTSSGDYYMLFTKVWIQ